jgi:membrane protein YdbS with pleckstrin-like domain
MSPLTLKPSPKFKIKLYLTYILIYLFLVFPWILLGLIPDLGAVYVVVFILASLIWLVPTAALIPAYVRSISYELREEELVVRKGIITRTTKVVPYRMITNTELKRGPLDRALGIGGIAVQTAGYSQTGGPEAKLAALEGYEAADNEILEAVRRYKAERLGVGEAKAAGPEAAPSETVLGEILAELRAVRELLEKRDGDAPDA